MVIHWWIPVNFLGSLEDCTTWHCWAITSRVFSSADCGTHHNGCAMVKGEHLQRPSLYHGKRFADHDVSCQCSYDDAAQCYDMKLGSPDMACLREGRFLGACVKSINHEGNGKYWEASGTPKMSNLLSPKGPKGLKYGINSFFTGFANFPFSTLPYQRSSRNPRRPWDSTQHNVPQQVERSRSACRSFQVFCPSNIFLDRRDKKMCFWMSTRQEFTQRSSKFN